MDHKYIVICPTSRTFAVVPNMDFELAKSRGMIAPMFQDVTGEVEIARVKAKVALRKFDESAWLLKRAEQELKTLLNNFMTREESEERKGNAQKGRREYQR